MRSVHVIGIGSGDPEQLTLQAVRVLGTLDVVFVVDKGRPTAELVALRRDICERYVDRPYRLVEIPEQSRDRAAADYPGAVNDWYDLRAVAFEAAMLSSLGPAENGGILVWGDPALYDSTLRVLDRVRARGRVDFATSVVPGITSLQTLAAAHRVTFTGLGEPVHVTTGRRLHAGMPAELDDVLVMLDGSAAFERLEDDDLDVYWGAYLGMPDQILVAGDLQERKAEIVALRNAARERKGWIMDSYLLRRRR
ncbi:MAG: precorrin-6A synthase (deacetylating) [Sporichthyaceae bacterium]